MDRTPLPHSMSPVCRKKSTILLHSGFFLNWIPTRPLSPFTPKIWLANLPSSSCTLIICSAWYILSAVLHYWKKIIPVLEYLHHKTCSHSDLTCLVCKTVFLLLWEAQTRLYNFSFLWIVCFCLIHVQIPN